MTVTAYRLAERFIGLRELPGDGDTPFILAMLRLDVAWPAHDEVPWCSAFVNYIAWLLRLPRSKSLAARSWLTVGTPVPLEAARQAFDVVVCARGPNPALGHVGFFTAALDSAVYLLGGNQGDAVSVAPVDRAAVLGVRRLFEGE